MALGGDTSMRDGKWTWMHAGEIDGESVVTGNDEVNRREIEIMVI